MKKYEYLIIVKGIVSLKASNEEEALKAVKDLMKEKPEAFTFELTRIKLKRKEDEKEERS